MELAQPHIAADGGARPAGASPHDDPVRYRKRLAAQLSKHRLGNVVIAAPVGSPFGVCELIQVVAAIALGKIGRHLIDRCRILHQLALTAVELDQLAFLTNGRGRHHGHERQLEQPREVGLADRRRP